MQVNWATKLSRTEIKLSCFLTDMQTSSVKKYEILVYALSEGPAMSYFNDSHNLFFQKRMWISDWIL